MIFRKDVTKKVKDKRRQKRRDDIDRVYSQVDVHTTWRSRTESWQSRNTKERHDVWMENVLLGCVQDMSIIKNNLYEPHARVVHVKSEDTTLRRLTNWQRLARHWEKCVHLPSLTREFILCKKEILCEKMLQKKESKEKRRWWRRDYIDWVFMPKSTFTQHNSCQTCDLVLHKALFKGWCGMSCSQRAKLSILLAECREVWSDSSQRLWRRCPGWWRSRTESWQSRNTKEGHDVWMENVLLGCALDMSIIKNNLYEPRTCCACEKQRHNTTKTNKLTKPGEALRKNVSAVRCSVYTSRRSQGNFFFVKGGIVWKDFATRI